MMVGPHGPPGNVPGMPFAGIPPEMADTTNALIAQEPDFSEVTEEYSPIPPIDKTFTLWVFLAPYKFRMLAALLLVGLTELLLLVGPYLIKVAIDDAIIPKNFTVLLGTDEFLMGTGRDYPAFI